MDKINNDQWWSVTPEEFMRKEEYMYLKAVCES